MRKLILALGAAAVALSAAPTEARHYSNMVKCVKHRHGRCVAWRRLTNKQARRYRVGYVFGPNYNYVPVTALPQPVVTRYSLTPDYRYVQSGPYIYVVDPTTYAVTRVLSAIAH